MQWVVDFDDQSSEWNAMEYLLAIKEKYPKFKVTLFTIPAESTYSDLIEWSKHDWIELALHGWTHMIDELHNPREMQKWDRNDSLVYFTGMQLYNSVFVKGLKAPGWQISDDTYDVANELGYWVMDRDYNDERRPFGLKYFSLDRPDVIHGHTWNCWGTVDNFIGDMIERGDFDKIKPEDDFKFVSEMVKPWQE